ncbi:hypothetical protein Rumeso_03427 [Rubellimicrobium mesophilum DSM 19309]|uniref:Uncharacterized protein n=1 Tax=Rubellimicrobium mesophilum DSM 19309 TaxID=442562 RepID=A0A017HLG9_9RHOB|nr:hypothetical protein [Rubellimicrobium mesophilum]EYD75003.1 hypothetical protein Rumeso_03427 [Rubellimicrobium mesophilum DSM 19309]
MVDLVTQLLQQQGRAQQPDLVQQLLDQMRTQEAARTGMMPPDPRIVDAFAGYRGGGGQPPAAPSGGVTREQLLAEAQRRQDAMRAQEQGRSGSTMTPTQRAALEHAQRRQDAARAGATGAPIVVTGPDGQQFEFPAGTSEEVMRQALARHYQGQGQGGRVQPQEAGATVSPEVQRAREAALRRVQAEAERRGLITGQGTSAGETRLERLDRLASPSSGQGRTLTPEQQRAIADTRAQMGATPHDDLLARLDRLQGPPPIPGSDVLPNVDANAFGGPPENADALSALLTPEGQAARRASMPPAPIPRENEWLGGVLPSPHQAMRNFSENLWGDTDDTTMNRGEALGASINKLAESATFGLAGDEANAYADSLLGRGSGDYATQRDRYRGQEEQLWQQHPALALGAEIGGALIGPGKGVGTFINRGAGTASRVGRGLLAGAGTGALYGAAEAERDPVDMQADEVGGVEDRVVGGLLGAGVGGVAGAAVTGIGQGFNRVARMFRGQPGAEDLAASAESLHDASQALYRQADASGVVLPQTRLAQLAADATDAVRAEGYHVRLHPRLRAVLSELRDVAAGDQSLSRVDQARRVAGNAAKSIEPDERRLASIVIDKIDDMIEELGTSSAPLREARALWARMSRLERVEQIFENASNVGPKGSFEDTLASGFRSLLRNPRNLRGFNEAERRAMQQVARGSTGVKALRSLADLLAPNSITGAGAAVGTFMNGGGLLTAVPPLVSYGARAASSGMVRAQGAALRNMVGQTDAQRALAEGLLRQPNALAGAANGATPQGLLDYVTSR